MTPQGRDAAKRRPIVRARQVPVAEITEERLGTWQADCERDHATPLVLVAIGHDDQVGTIHIYRMEDGPSDAELAVLLGNVVQTLMGG